MLSGTWKRGLPEPLLGAVREARARSRQLVRWSGRELHHTLSSSGAAVSVASPSDWAVYNEIFVDGEYDRAIHSVLVANADAPLVVDLGANVGYFALRFAELWSRHCPDAPYQLISVEGCPRTFDRLHRHLTQPVLQGRCVAHHGLAGRRTGAAAITTSPLSGLNSISVRGRQSLSRAIVPFIDVESIVPPNRRIALLKCDIEGSEELFFDSYPQLLRRVDLIVVEFHPNLNDVSRCRTLLSAAGFEHHRSLRIYSVGSVELFARDAALVAVS
jgi:FkbM family methyltransferase